MLVSVYVGGLIDRENNVPLMEVFEFSIHREFDITDLGKMNFFLGVEVLQTSHGIHMSQPKFTL